MTEGMKTSEFWLTLVLIIAATLLAWGGTITEQTWLLVSTGGAAGYSISRGLAKKTP